MTIVQLHSRDETLASAEAATNSYAEALDAIGQALAHLHFGTIVLTVHESRVVQLEVTQKKRFAK